MKRLKIYFKWKYLRNKTLIGKVLEPSKGLTENQKLIKSVLIKIVSNPESTVLISPLSNIVYIQTKNDDYTIVLAENKIKITNHKMFIEMHVDNKFSEELFEIVYHYVEKFRLEMDKEIFKNEVDGLNYMLNKLNKLK